jgi:acetyl esterase
VLLFCAMSAAQPTAEQLRDRLKKFPEADVNGDGVFTEAEARAHQRKRKESRAATKDESATASARANRPTFADVTYGAHPRQRLDFWRASSERPTPVLVFFHGGSFKAGDKAKILTRPMSPSASMPGSPS